MVMKCNNCGAEITNDVNFCELCGAKVDKPQNIEDSSVVEEESQQNSDKKYSVKEMANKIAGIIEWGLAAISGIMVIGIFLGFFDTNPVPFVVFVCVVRVIGWLREKLPKIPAIFFAIFEIVAIIICFNIGNHAALLLSVKWSSPSLYPDITYEEAFEDYFANPTWETCGKDAAGNEVVKFSGICTYLGSNAIAEVTFTVYKKQDSFVVSSTTINGVNMDDIGNIMVLNAFEEYQNSH